MALRRVELLRVLVPIISACGGTVEGGGAGEAGMGGSANERDTGDAGGGGAGGGAGSDGARGPEAGGSTCGRKPPAEPSGGKGGKTGKFNDTYGSGAGQRALGIYVPSGYTDGDGTYGLVVLLHDIVCENWVHFDAYSPIAAKEKLILAAPQAQKGQPGWSDGGCAGGWDSFRYGGKSEDGAGAAMLRDVIKKMEAAYNIDRKRTHVAGFSNGAFYAVPWSRAADMADPGAVEYVIHVEGGSPYIDKSPKFFRQVFVSGEDGCEQSAPYKDPFPNFRLAQVPGVGHYWPGVSGKPTKDCFGKDASTLSLHRWLECGE